MARASRRHTAGRVDRFRRKFAQSDTAKAAGKAEPAKTEEAAKYVEALKKTKRYKRDVY